MADLLKLSMDYHRLVSRRLEASGLSPRQLAVHKRILELAAQASDADDLEAKKNAEGLTFALSQAIAVDNWTAKARAAREMGLETAARVYEETAQAASEASEAASLASAVDAASSAGMKALRQEEELKVAFSDALYAVFEYRVTHGANAPQRENLARTLGIHTSKLASKGRDFEKLAGEHFWRELAPLSDAQWEKVLEVYAEMASPGADSAAQAELAEEVERTRKELADRLPELAEVERHIAAHGTRAVYLGIAPLEEPGPYTFEKIWEGGRDE